MYDLTNSASIRNDKVSVVLKPVAAGDELVMEGLRFKPFSTSLADNSGSELRRLSRLIRSVPQFTFEIQVQLVGYVEDSVKSNPDLTESFADSSLVTIEDIDSLGQLITRDSVVSRITFHNDRTEKQANTILDQLELLGIDRRKLSISVKAKPEEIIENRKTLITVVVKGN